MTVNLSIVKMRPGMGLFGLQVRIFDGESDETDEHILSVGNKYLEALGTTKPIKLTRA